MKLKGIEVLYIAEIFLISEKFGKGYNCAKFKTFEEAENFIKPSKNKKSFQYGLISRVETRPLKTIKKDKSDELS